MQKYTKVAFESRWLDLRFDWHSTWCEYCKERIAVDVDHIEGRLWKLKNEPYNLILLCRECHMAKTRKHVQLFKDIVKNILDNNFYS